ncbi:hypothetical protein B0H11DRAFT_2224190 [Mycena galericulata]|nr:hypothetical protein B0H11DRAFT_2224190 [Mycena galericulata]
MVALWYRSAFSLAIESREPSLTEVVRRQLTQRAGIAVRPPPLCLSDPTKLMDKSFSRNPRNGLRQTRTTSRDYDRSTMSQRYTPTRHTTHNDDPFPLIRFSTHPSLPYRHHRLQPPPPPPALSSCFVLKTRPDPRPPLHRPRKSKNGIAAAASGSRHLPCVPASLLVSRCVRAYWSSKRIPTAHHRSSRAPLTADVLYWGGS